MAQEALDGILWNMEDRAREKGIETGADDRVYDAINAAVASLIEANEQNGLLINMEL
jgi:hypothetical protein